MDGDSIGAVTGLALERTTRESLLAGMESVDDLVYEVDWRDRPFAGGLRPADFLASPSAVSSRFVGSRAYLEAEGVQPDDVGAFLSDLERLSKAYVLQGLEQLGWQRVAGAAVDPQALRLRWKVVSDHEQLLHRLFGMLADAGLLTPDPDTSGGWIVAVGSGDSLPNGVPGDAGAFADALAGRHPHGSNELGLLCRCGSGLAEVLRGRSDPLELLLGDGAPNAASLQRDAPVMRAASRVAADAIASAVDLPEGRRLRVLELGAGPGGTTDWALSALPEGQFDYVYTDVSAGFFAEAEARFVEYGSSIEYRVLDIERGPAEQGFEVHGYDLVIAANVLHATRDLGGALRHCRSLLAPSGQLVVLERLRGQGWLDLTFGLLEGWWRFADAYRTDYPLASETSWRQALSDAGFAEVAVLGAGAAADGDLAGQAVILAQAPARVVDPEGVWLLVSDRSGAAPELARHLASRNQAVVLALDEPPKGGSEPDAPGISVLRIDHRRPEAWRSLLEGLSPEAPLRGVVHLAALDGHGPDASTAELSDDLNRAGSSALALAQALSGRQIQPVTGLWFVTRGAQIVEREPGRELAGAALWGLGRSVALEAARLHPRMVDLDPGGHTGFAALVDELLYPDRETLVAHRDTRRLAARLVRSGANRPLDRSPSAAEDRVTAEEAGSCSEDGTYLVTGGPDGRGPQIAGWLADRGARSIVLCGLEEPPAEAMAAIDALRARDVAVRLEVGDLSQPDAIDAILEAIDAALPPLAGVIHDAGGHGDGSFENRAWKRFERGLREQALAAWHLHRATRDRDLGMFVLCSDAGGVLGRAGRTSQMAASAFLDQLVRHRRALGLVGTSIAWGRWFDREASEAPSRYADVREAGCSITPRQGLEALDRFLRREVSAGLAAWVDWSSLAADSSAPPLLEEVLPQAKPRGEDVSGSPGDLLARLGQAPLARRESLLLAFLAKELQAVLRLPSAPDPTAGFFSLGMDSLMAVELTRRLNRELSSAYTVRSSIVFDHPDTAALARHLAEELGVLGKTRARPDPLASEHPQGGGIAVVGMACRFPGGNDLSAFWHQLEAGANAVTKGRPSLGAAGKASREPGDAGGDLGWGCFIDGIDQFDAEFFRIAPVEARLLDPQQRLLLETSWEALEQAGINPGLLKGSRTGVFAGLFSNDYRELVADNGQDAGSLYAAMGSSDSVAIGRVAYTLGLEGPAVAVDTACSSSLVAVHYAVAALQRGEADLALAGGANAILSPALTGAFVDGGMLSPDGQCKTFDAAANGYVRGEGCGIVVLKRLEDAEADGDRVWAVIRGSAVNQDGASAGLTVPNGPAQERVIREALGRAGLSPSEVDYLEAHGTGTELGDPIEVHAAAAAYGLGREENRPLLIGSVKTNIGHLEAAAGVAGLIKVVLAMRHGVIPGHLNFREPNPLIDWDRIPIQVTSAKTPWPSTANRPVRAGVSSFGFSGTNAHVVVEGHGASRQNVTASSEWAPDADLVPAVEVPWPALVPDVARPSGPVGPREIRLLPLSGKSRAAVRDLAGRYLSWLGDGSGSPPAASEDSGVAAWKPSHLADVAWTAAVGRSHFEHRAALVFGDGEELRRKLAEVAANSNVPALRSGAKVAFIFAGQGSQWAGMGRGLYESEPVARAVLDRCDAVMRELRGDSLLDVMFGRNAANRDLDRTEWTQPALYALECALVELWASLGIRPVAVLGHSVGELAAARAAGVFGLEDGLRFASERGELMGSLPTTGSASGAMTAVFAPAREVASAVAAVNESSDGLSLNVAADNGSHQVVSGPAELVAELEQRLDREGTRVGRLNTSHAFHSALMEPVLERLESALDRVDLEPPAVPMVSNVTGRAVGHGQVLDGGYWRRHARETVAFADGVAELAELGAEVVVEIGPKPVLGPLAQVCWPSQSALPAVVASQKQSSDESGPAGGRAFLEAVAEAYDAGAEIAFEGLFAGEKRRRVSLPTYPFQRRRCWIEPGRGRRAARGHPLLGERRDSAGGEITFETQMSASDPDWLDEHRVFGRVVAPAALHGALVAAAASDVGFPPVVEDLRLQIPLIFEEDEGEPVAGGRARTLQVVLDRTDEAGARRVALYSKGADELGWALHVEGRMGSRQAGGPSRPRVDLEGLKARLSTANVAALYEDFSGSGIDYGGAFRRVRAVWAGTGEAVGEVALPPEVDPGGSQASTTLLDGCFQVVLAAAQGLGVDRAATYLPFEFERLWLADSLPARVISHVQVRTAAEGEGNARPEALTADLRLYDAEGLEIGEATGFTWKLASRAAFLSAVTGFGELAYEVVWREQAQAAGRQEASLLRWPASVAGELPGFERCLEAEGMQGDELVAFLSDMERLSWSYALAALERLGWRPEPGTSVDPGELRPRLKIVSDYEPLLRRLFGLLAEAGVVAPDPGQGGRWVVTDSKQDWPGDPEPLATMLRDGDRLGMPELSLLARCGAALPDVLLGRADALELLYGSTGPGAAEMYRESRAARGANRTVAAAVAAAVPDLPDSAVIRVLEVGASTGGTTPFVLEALPQGRVEYIYTDASAAFFEAAERRIGGSDTPVEFRVLDIEVDPREQGFNAHSFDLVVATNALSATRDLSETLLHCRQLLAPSGILVTLEGVRRQGWLDLTFGLLGAWWRFGDSRRQDHPLATEPVWRQALADAGFSKVDFTAANLSEDDQGPVHGLMVAQGPAEVVEPPGVWVLASDRDIEVDGLAAQLASRNQTVVVAGPECGSRQSESGTEGMTARSLDPARREEWKALFEGLPDHAPLEGIVSLAGIENGKESLRPEQLAADLSRTGASALALVQGLLDAGRLPSKGLWFVTRGAQVVSREPATALAGATLWGFARAVSLEAGQLRPRLVDLDSETPDHEGVVDEFFRPDSESQVAYRTGVRHVARVVRSGAAQVPESGGAAPAQTPPLATGRLRADRTYLVTGGLGGIGGAIATWLADCGAGAIVLNGRRPPGEQAEALIGALRNRGIRARAELADVADANALEEMLRRIEADLPPLAGVIHGAAAWSDASLSNQSWERFERVLSPKVLGAWNLHLATADRDLDMFVLFSSVVGVLGNAGQSNYAAASAFLDQLARHRSALGLPCQSIAWGPWSGVGSAEEGRERIAGQMAAAGIGWIAPRQGIGALEQLLRRDRPTAVVAPVDWSVHLARLASPAPHLKEVLPAAAPRIAAPRTSPADLLSRLRQTTQDGRQALLLSFVRGEVQAVLRLPAPPEPAVGFFDLGMDSLMAVELRSRLNRALSGEFSVSNTVVFDYPSTQELARHLADRLGLLSDPAKPPEPVVRNEGKGDRIAVVGMACRFPGGADLEQFWEQLASGRNAVTDGRRDSGNGFGIDLFPRRVEGRETSHWASFVEGIDRFDAEFFRIAPVEARLMDPQQRLLLETSWLALEDAGIDPDHLRGSRGGVFAGLMNSDYRELVASSEAGLPGLYVAAGNHDSAAIGRISFTLGLEGPAMAVDTACSSSLVAVHQAVAALRRGETDLALAGGVNAILTPVTTETYADAGMLSPDGLCKTFDESADGYGRGEGCGIVILKRLSDAEADGDRIWGVIRGSAVNQDGASAGLTVPNGPAQERVIEAALATAGLEPSQVDYLEAHGTGTQLGDPIEVHAAASVYGRGREAGRPLLIGSVKTNIGHLESAAGIAGLIKVLLSMRRELIPKHLNFRAPNPRIEWDRLPVRVTSEATPWPSASSAVMRAAVSSFGFSGTNAHVVVEGYLSAGGVSSRPATPTAGLLPGPGPAPLGPRSVRWLPLSGKTAGAVRELAGRYVSWLDDRADSLVGVETEAAQALADMAWTASLGRSHFDHRAGLVFSDAAELRSKLEKLASTGPAERIRSEPKVAFVFTGQGSQWAGMGRGLYECEPVVRAVLDRCDNLMRELRGASLLDVMFGRPGAAGDLDDTAWTQPALYALECAQAELWASVGLRPAAVLGHSVGELAAAQVAGVFGLEEGLRFAAARGELMGVLPADGSRAGAMAAVFASAERVAAAVDNANARISGVGLSVAADNGAHQVISGPLAEVEQLSEQFSLEGVRVERLNTTHAFHSGLMDPVLDDLESALEGLDLSAPDVALVSNVTGRVAGPGDFVDGAYWRRQARETVAFADGVAALSDSGIGVVVEIGPRPVLGTMVELAWPSAQAGETSPVPVVLSSLRQSRAGDPLAEPIHDEAFAAAAAQAYEAGAELSFAGLFAGEQRRRVSLPSYPFQRERFWVDPPGWRTSSQGHPLLGVRRESVSGEVTFETEMLAADPAWMGGPPCLRPCRSASGSACGADLGGVLATRVGCGGGGGPAAACAAGLPGRG